MDISKLSHGAKLIIAGTAVFLVVSFFDWFQVNDVGFANMWHGIGVLAGLLAIALLVWEIVRLANVNVALPVTPAMTSAFLAVLVLIFTFIRWIDTPGQDVSGVIDVGRTFWAWLGLILAIAIVVGAWLNMQAAGEGLADIKSQVSSAATAAKGTVDRDDKPAETASAAADPAPAAPAAPEPPAAEPDAPRADT